MTNTPRISPQVPQSCTGRPSVPLSVYRELVKELQATQARAESLEAQNQQLVKSNRQLRQEIEGVVRSEEERSNAPVLIRSIFQFDKADCRANS